MLRRADPVGHHLREFVGRVPGVRRRHDLHQAVFACRGDGLAVAFENPLERLLLLPLGMLRRQGLDAVKREGKLHVDWLLRPQRAVVVEHGNPRGRRHEVRSALPRHAAHEVDDRPFRRALVPRRQRVARLRARRHCRRRCGRRGTVGRLSAGARQRRHEHDSKTSHHHRHPPAGVPFDDRTVSRTIPC